MAPDVTSRDVYKTSTGAALIKRESDIRLSFYSRKIRSGRKVLFERRLRLLALLQCDLRCLTVVAQLRSIPTRHETLKRAVREVEYATKKRARRPAESHLQTYF